MNEVIESTGTIIPERTPDIIATEIRIIEMNVGRTVLQGAVEIGNRLQEIKETLPHGEWESWCRQNLNYSKSKAERFMKISTEYGDENSPYFKAISKTSTLTDLSISNALSLLKVPEEDVENFVDNVDLSTSTVKELEEEIKKLKEEHQASLDDMEMEYKKADSKVLELEGELREADEKHQELMDRIDSLQEELNHAAPEIDAKELENLKEQLEKAQSDVAKLKDKEKAYKEEKKAAEESAQKKLKDAVAEAEAKVKEEAAAAATEEAKAEIEALTREKEQALDRARNAEAKLSASDSEAVAEFKVLVDQLQGICQKTIAALEQIDQEKRNKLRPALNGILQSYIKE